MLSGLDMEMRGMENYGMRKNDLSFNTSHPSDRKIYFVLLFVLQREHY